MDVIRAPQLSSLCPLQGTVPRPVTIAVVQSRWHADERLHRAQLQTGIRTAAEAGAAIVFLPELTLARYPADQLPEGRADALAENLEGGPTHQFAAEMAAQCDVLVHASLFERTGSDDGRGYNTAILVGTDGSILAHTRKLHIPVTAGYYEDQYFEQGPAQHAYPVHRVELDALELNLGMPTCWDEWFPEVARSYALGGAELLCYPTAIGSEPDHPQFDTQPLWQQVIVGHAIANGLFIAVPNRFGNEGALNFYGSSFIVDPFGRILAQAPRTGEAVLVADIDLAYRSEWLNLFPFFATRRPDTYSALGEPLLNPRSDNGWGVAGGIAGLAP